MENRSRVGDIRKKFEGLNVSKKPKNAVSRDSQHTLDPGPASDLSFQKPTTSVHIERQNSGSSNSGIKGNIKRSHAFRSDKQPPTFSSITGKMVAVQNNQLNNIRPLENAVSELFVTNDTKNTINEVPDQITVDDRCCKTKLNINFNPSIDFAKSSLNEHKVDLDISTINNQVAESSLCNLKRENCKGESVLHPSYSTVLKPSNRTLSKNAHKPNILQLSSHKKTQISIRNSVNGDKDNNVTTSNKLKYNKFDEIRGKSSEANITFNEVKSIFENNEFGKNKCARLPECVSRNSIKEVLKSPLPKGPPPKKPPRTFAHNIKFTTSQLKYMPSSSDSEMNSPEEKKTKSHLAKSNSSSINESIVHRPIRSKTESQIMLKKLEIALLNHQHGVLSCNSKINNKEEKEDLAKDIEGPTRNRHNKLQTATRRTSLDDDVIIGNEESSFIPSGLCFRSLNCSTSNETIKSSNIYDTPFEPKSTFFIEKPAISLPTEKLGLHNIESNRSTNKFDGKINLSKEHVYAEPCGKNKGKSEGLKSPNLSSIKKDIDKSTIPQHRERNHVTTQLALNQSNNELHYMSTSILDREKSLESLVLNSTGRKQYNQNIAEAINTKLQILNNQDDINCSVHSLDKQKIQMMVNEAYGKCLNLPVDGGSDSDSIASTPDETAIKTVLDHDTPIPTDFVLKEREREREQRTAERKGYLRRVCSRGKSFHRPASVSDISSPHPNLFEYLLLVGLDLDPSRCKVPYIKSKYPPDVAVPNGIESLCFPDASDWPPQGCKDESVMGGCYCLILTNSSGVRKYGYCRRVQPEGAAICLPLAYCVVSPFKDNSFFNKILVELESHHGQSENNLTNFIEELYKCPYPAPGQAVVVTRPSTGQRIEIVRRPLDQRQEEVDIARLLNLVRLSVFLQLFGTLLLERKVVLISHSISKLSACVEGLQAALFPFHWQHTLVPVVPSTMIDLCHAPTPYIIGLLKHRHDSIEPLSPLENIDQVLVVDVDDSRVLRSLGDEGSILPSRLNRGLRTALQLAMTECINSATTNANLIASEALIRLFVELLGHFRDHIITSTETGKRNFQRENFVKSVNSNSKQHFLDWFSETAMFTAFIEERLDRNINPRGVFEQRCVEYLSDRSHPNFLKNYKGINKTVKTLGDRLKDWAALS